MDVDPEALIKCTTITSGGVASSTPTIQGDKVKNLFRKDHCKLQQSLYMACHFGPVTR